MSEFKFQPDNENSSGLVAPGEMAPGVAPGASGNGLAPDWRDNGGAPVNVNVSGRYQMEPNEGVDLGQLLRIFARRWKAMLLMFMACVALSVVYLKTARPVYQAAGRLQLVESSGSGIQVPGLEDLLSDNKTDDSIETQIQLLGGPAVRTGAVESLKPTEKPGLEIAR